MKEIKILHIADVHLGSDFRTLGRKAASRRNDMKDTFIDIIKLCKAEEVQLLLIAGDLFESWSVSEDYYELVREGFESIPDTIVAIAAGNHDPLTPDSLYLKENYWSDNVVIFPPHYTSYIFAPLELELWGASFSTPYAYSSMLKPNLPREPEYLQIGVIHGTTGTDSLKNEYNPISLSQIAESGLDYLALGHIHKPSGVEKSSRTYFAYPGPPEGRGFDELGERGVLIGTVAKNNADLQFHPTGKRMYIEEAIDISDCSGSKSAASIIADAIHIKYGDNYDNNLYKVYLEGKIKDNINISIESIKSYLSELYYVKLRDRTQVDIDIETASKENNLKGYFVRNMLEEMDGRENPVLDEALKIGLKAFFGEVEYSED